MTKPPCTCEFCEPCKFCKHQSDEHLAGDGLCFICECPGFIPSIDRPVEIRHGGFTEANPEQAEARLNRK